MLKDATVKNAKPAKDGKGKPKARKLADSNGLYVYVSETGAKSWRYDYRFNGRRSMSEVFDSTSLGVPNAGSKLNASLHCSL